jgi:hypothetical protein
MEATMFTNKKMGLEEAWSIIDKGLGHLLVNQTEGFSEKDYMECYRYSTSDDI